MNNLDIKIKKEKIKEMAKNSILFSSSTEALELILSAIDQITEDEQGNIELDNLILKFKEEKESISNGFREYLGK